MFQTVFCFHSISRTLLLFGIVLLTLHFIQCKSSAKFPDYIQRCKKDDPQLNACISKLLESLRPRFDKGIPEFELPPVDPLVVPEVVFLDGQKGGIKAKASSIIVTGLKDFQIKSLSVDLNRLEFNSTTYIPYIHFEGIYDVNAKFSGFKVKGIGPFEGNASDITSNTFVKGKLVTNEGVRYLEFTSAKVDVTFGKHHIRVDKLFKSKETTDIFNRVLNDPSAFPMEQVKALINDFGSRMVIETWNKKSKLIPFDEFFL